MRIATSQFPVSEDMHANELYISRHIRMARRNGAAVVHFPETALSGYETPADGLDWERIDAGLHRIQDMARAGNIHVIVGAHQRCMISGKSYNAVFVFSNSGGLLGTYAKRRLYAGECARFTPGSDSLTVEMDGIRCGFLICYDSCFPEFFQEYRNEEVRVLFLSYHNARNRPGRNSLDSLMEAQLRTRAADHGMYISASNSSAYYSRMPSGVASPDGSYRKLRRHRPGIRVYDYPTGNLGWTYDNRAVQK